MTEPDYYRDREQTLVKHFILRKYLERFAHIVGTFAGSITYIDCFSGPWQERSEELRDTSFSIALEELRKARTTLRQRGRDFKIRCLFLEKESGAHAKLAEFAAKVQDAEIRTINRELTTSIDDILGFVRGGGQSTFPFFFIDPTGWTGFEMDLIAPLLRHRPGEVLINFMTDFIRRFIDHPLQRTRDQFSTLFGSGDVQSRLQALPDHQDREDALIRAYADTVQRIGGFRYSCAAIVFYPDIDRSYFHLIYATRDRKGLEVFKEVEQKAMEVMEERRAEAKQRKRTRRTGQPELFPASEMPNTQPVQLLRTRYLDRARELVRQRLVSGSPVPYDAVWDLALSYPLVWDRDVKDWIADWKDRGWLRVEGMKPRQRVPRLDEKNMLAWQGN